jgi:signal transduction histidine kinase
MVSSRNADNKADGIVPGEGGRDGQAPAPRPTILVVDDSELARDVLTAMLEPEGFEVVCAASGEEAFRAMRDRLPDLILLDIMLPGMDGFDICRGIRADERTKAIPVIMVTALTAREQRIAGLESGADDFVSKPIDKGEIIARIRSHLRAKALMDELERKHAELRELQESRELLVHMILHDVKGPIGAIEGCLHLIGKSASERLSAEEKRHLETGSLACRIAMDLLHDVLDAMRLERNALPLHRREFDMAAMAEEKARLCGAVAARRNVAMVCEIEPELKPLHVRADPDLTGRILSNLLLNAIRHTPEGRKVAVSIRRTEGGVKIEVSDEGEGISKAEMGRLFARLDQIRPGKSSARRGGGFGLYFCRLAAEAHGGRIWAESEPGRGSRFHVFLPSNGEAASERAKK